MRTTDVSAKKPVQDSGQQKKADPKKPQKDFKEVLGDQHGAKQAGGAKKKPFSPLNRGEQKETAAKMEKAQTSKEHDRIESKLDREADGLELGSGGKGKKSMHSNEEMPLAMPQQMGIMDPAAMQKTTQVEKTQGAGGLNLEELQSIVKKCDVGINEQGKPEMNFEIDTHNLGKMDLKVTADGDQIKINFATEDVNAQKVLEENIKELKNMLQEKGLNLADTSFSSRDQDKQEQQQQQQEQAWEGPMYSDLPTGRPKKGFSL